MPGTTGQAILQAARPLQKLLRHIPEHQTTGNKGPQGPPFTPGKGREINPADSTDKDTIYTYTPDGEQHSQSRHQQEDQAKAAIAADDSNKPRETQQQLHALYIAACDELGIPEKATNSDMQRVACQVYQDIWSYADHLLAMLRVLTLAKTPRSKATKKTEPPIIQLRRLVARGWTLDQRQHNTAQEGMSQMALPSASQRYSLTSKSRRPSRPHLTLRRLCIQTDSPTATIPTTPLHKPKKTLRPQSTRHYTHRPHTYQHCQQQPTQLTARGPPCPVTASQTRI